MGELRRAAAIGIGVLFGVVAEANDGTVDLDAVDKGRTHSLDAVDIGETDDLDEADTGHTNSLDSADTGKTDSLDSVDTGETVGLDAADTGKTVELDTAETDVPAPVAAPAPVPDLGSSAERAEAQRIREEAVVASQRLDGANAAYSQMMARGYPVGDARARIVQQRETARSAYRQATTRYAAYLAQLGQRGDSE
ncbi:MAG TPA: hypothetical protein VII72_01320 [Myxococcota bacterium]|jgi:hypothetical protein